jgi:hypothetical protein
MVFKEAMRKYDAKNPIADYGGRRPLCCSCMTIRMQKRYSFVAVLIQAHPLPKNPNTPYFRGVRIYARPCTGRLVTCAHHGLTTRSRAGRIVLKP